MSNPLAAEEMEQSGEAAGPRVLGEEAAESAPARGLVRVLR